MEKLVNTIKLMAKSGLFFANCDGEVSIHEKEFIKNFLGSILEVGTIDEGLKNDVKDTLNHTYTLEDIIEETIDDICELNLNGKFIKVTKNESNMTKTEEKEAE